MKKFFLTLLLGASVVASAQVVPPQIPLTGNIGSGGIFPLLNSGTLQFPSDANHTMVYPEMSASFIKVTSAVSLTATRNLVAPLTLGYSFTIENATSGGQSIQIIGATGTGVTIPNGTAVTVASDGTNYVSTGGSTGAVLLNPSGSQTINYSVNGINSLTVTNPSAGASAGTAIAVSNGTDQFELGINGTGTSSPGAASFINSRSGAPMAFLANNGAVAFSATSGFTDFLISPTTGNGNLRGNLIVQGIATSPSTSPICPNGTGGALTTAGCTGGGSLPSGTGIVAVNSGTGALATQVQISEGLASGANVQIGAPGAVGDGTTDDTAALQAAITNNRYLVLASGKNYLISAALTIPCGVTSIIDFNYSPITLASGSNSYMFFANCTNGDGTSIKLLHGALNGNGQEQTRDYTSSQLTGYFGFGMLFYQVDNLQMQDWTITNTNAWGVAYSLCGNVSFTNFTFAQNTSVGMGNNGDGITGSAQSIYVNGVRGFTNDDMVAVTTGTASLQGHDVGVTTGQNIDIQNVDIENVNSVALSSSTSYGIGIYPTAGHTIHNLLIANVAGLFTDHVLRIYDFWPAAGVTDYLKNIHLSNIQGQIGTPGSITAALKIADISIPFSIIADAATAAPNSRPGFTFAPQLLAAEVPLYSSKFIGAGSAALSTFIPDTGVGWTTVNGSWALSSGGTFLQQNTTISSGILRGGAITTIPNDQVSQDNYTISSLMFAGNLIYVPGIVFRYQDANNFWLAEMETSQLAIYEASGGVLTLIASTPGTLPVSTVYTLSVIAVGSSIVAQMSNASGMLTTPLITSTDFEAATSIGVKSPDPSARIYNLQASFSYGIEPGFSTVNNALLSANNVFTGNNYFAAVAAATSSANVNSPNMTWLGHYWTGTASATDTWNCYDNLSVWTGSPTNPQSDLECDHSGSSGGGVFTTASASFANFTGHIFNIFNTSGSQAAEVSTSSSATSGANFNSPIYSVIGNYWNGSMTSTDLMGWEDILGTGSNPTAAMTLVHIGTTGATSLDLTAANTTKVTSLLATGIVDGTTPVTITTTATATLGGTYHSGYTFNNDGATAVTYTLPTAAAGLQYCARNSTGATGTLKIATSASGQFIDNAGANTATGGYVISGGALGDAACVVGMDATHWMLYVQLGTWTTH